MTSHSNQNLDPGSRAATHPPLRQIPLILFTVAFFIVWTIWAVYLSKYPLPPSRWPLRLLTRIIVLFIPAVIYIRFYLKQPIIGYLRLDTVFTRGLACGCAAGLLPVAALAYQSIRAHKLPALPTSPEIWLNVILAAPICEELLFRGLLFREFKRVTTPICAAILNSLLFAALHFPYWFFSHAKTGYHLLGSLTLIFAIGLVCSALTQISRTLTAPIVFHVINNLASSCTV